MVATESHPQRPPIPRRLRSRARSAIPAPCRNFISPHATPHPSPPCASRAVLRSLRITCRAIPCGRRNPSMWTTRGKKDLDVVVVEELRSRGYQAVSAKSGAPVEKYDAVITCYDRWCWDITPYLMELQLKVVDPKTQSLVACGESYRPTFQRARPSTVVKQTLQAMLDTPPGRRCRSIFPSSTRSGALAWGHADSSRSPKNRH